MLSVKNWRMAAILILGAMMFMVPHTVNAALITIDFDLPDGTTVDNQYAGLGVVFSGYDIEPRPITTATFGNPSGTIMLDSYCWAPGYIQADFTTAVDYVSVDFTVFEGDAPLGLELYDATDTLLASVAAPGVDGVTQILEAQAAMSNVAYARFFAPNAGGVNAVYHDAFTFGTYDPVPEPATMLLLGSGLLGLAGLGRKKLKT